MKTNKRLVRLLSGLVSAIAAPGGLAQNYAVNWHTIDCGGEFSAGGSFELDGTIGQPDPGVMTGGSFELAGGFWPGIHVPGVPAATLIDAVSRKPNAAGPGGFCDLPLISNPGSEPRLGGLTEIRLKFDVAPAEPGNDPVTLEQATCASPEFVEYTGASAISATRAGNSVVLTFTPGLENGRTYRLSLGAELTSVPGQFLEVSVLLGDVNADGFVNGTDRSVVVGVWTGGGFNCPTDLNSDGGTNATDRSMVVGAWTGAQNCAP